MASIIDNRNKTMLESLKNSLKQAERVDILTAFFYFSGFNALAEDLKDKKIRILDDCIEQEFNIMIDNARKDYLIRRCLQLSDEEYFAKKQELLEDGELFLTALKEFNKKELLMRRMKRKNVKRFMKLTMGEYLEIINQLIDTETDAEIDTILRKL